MSFCPVLWHEPEMGVENNAGETLAGPSGLWPRQSEGRGSALAQENTWPREQQLEGLCYIQWLQASFSPPTLPASPAELLFNRVCVRLGLPKWPPEIGW